MAQLETEQTENIINSSISEEDTSDNESLIDPSNQNKDISGEDTGTTGENIINQDETGEDNINQEETLGDNEKTGEETGENTGTANQTGEDTGITDETKSNTESLTDPSTSTETSTYTPDEVIEMTKQTSDQADTSSDQETSASSPIIYIPKTLILGQDGNCDYIVQFDNSTLKTNQEIQVIPSETFEMINIHNEDLKYIGTTSQDKNIISIADPLIHGSLKCDIKRPGSYKGIIKFNISINTRDIATSETSESDNNN